MLLAQGRTKAAIDHLKQAVQLLREIGARRDEVYALTYLARAYEVANDFTNARMLHQTALNHRQEIGQQKSIIDNLAGLARLALEENNLSTACSYVHDIQAHIRSQGFPVSETPFLIYLTAIRVMQTCGKNEEARKVILEAAHTLQARAALISDLALRRSYLEKVPENAAITSLAATPGLTNHQRLA